VGSTVTAAPPLAPDATGLSAAILEALAQVRAVSLRELHGEMAASGGDLEIDSREAEAVIAILEYRYGRALADVEDLEPERLLSVGSLAELIRRGWPTSQPVAAGGAE
jgi:acyl carrier protein